MESNFYEAAIRLARAERVVVFTGAGISADSGLPVYRGPHGVWQKKDPNFFGSADSWQTDPVAMAEATQNTRNLIRSVSPSTGHKILVQLEKHFREFTIITQNVDGLHEKAGNSHVLELHGNIFRNQLVTGASVSEDEIDWAAMPPTTQEGKLVRPAVVYFGEALPEETLEEARQCLHRSQVMLVIGTSLKVDPAASLVFWYREPTIEINPESVLFQRPRSCYLAGTAAYVLPRLYQEFVYQRAHMEAGRP